MITPRALVVFAAAAAAGAAAILADAFESPRAVFQRPRSMSMSIRQPSPVLFSTPDVVSVYDGDGDDDFDSIVVTSEPTVTPAKSASEPATEVDASIEKPLLIGASAGLIASVYNVCSRPVPLTISSVAMAPLIALASVGVAKSFLPVVRGQIDIPENTFSRNLGAHIFSSTANFVLAAMLLPLLDTVAKKAMLGVSMTFLTTGSIMEIVAHFRDRWVFGKGTRALEGVENMVFWTGLTGAFSFLGAAFAPSVPTFLLALVPPAILVKLAVSGKWNESKKITTAVNSVTTLVTVGVMMKAMKSYWPIMYLVQGYNVVRNSSLITETKNQNLHVLPSAYGWFSYTFPFALALHPYTRASSLLLVMAASALTVVGSDILEKMIVKYSSTS